MNENRFNTFAEMYRVKLQQAITAFPNQYPWVQGDSLTVIGNTETKTFTAPTFDTVVHRMLDAIRRKSYNKEGLAFKWTCKALGIKHTYKAIDEYLER